MNIADHLFDLVQGVTERFYNGHQDRPDLDAKSLEVARAFRFDIACAVQAEALRLGLARPVAEEPGDAVEREERKSAADVIVALILENRDKARQAIEQPEVWSWFAGQIALRDINHQVGRAQLYGLVAALAAAPKANGVGTGEEGLDARLKAAGMFTVTEMLGVTPMTKWQTHSGMNSLQAFEQWLDRRSAEFLRMKAGYELGDKLKDDELYEWTLAHCAAFSEVRTNLKAALAAKPEGEKASAGEPSYGIIDPDYARIFTQARCIAWQEGYALTMHGSFTRDLDLIAIPWTDAAKEPDQLVRRIAQAADLTIATEEPGTKPHGRLVWTLTFPGFGDPRWVDFSVLPALTTSTGSGGRAEVPKGWKLVPVEATEKMFQAGLDAPGDKRPLDWERKDVPEYMPWVWAAMLDAAPSAPAALVDEEAGS